MILFLALVLDWFVGDPDHLWKRVPHPVALIGKGIEFFDKKFNLPGLPDNLARQRGTLVLVQLVAASLIVGLIVASLLDTLGFMGWVLEIMIVSVFLAQKSLVDHVRNVSVALRIDGIAGGRKAVAKIVGRDPERLDRSGVCRAAIESLAENFSDGVVAPAIWYAILGLPGLIAYKTINTADSMMGHKNDQYLHFGSATARFDDLINWPAARLASFLIAVASGLKAGWSHGLNVMDRVVRDAGTHRSLNAGWPETAMAASLNIALGGPRRYEDEQVQEALLNADQRSKLDVGDIDRALDIFTYACFSLWLMAFLFS